MERQFNADIPDMLVYFGRYELRIAEVGKEELDTTRALNDGIKMAHTMKSMLLNLEKHCSSTEVTIERVIMSGLKINFFRMRHPRGYFPVVSEMEEYYFLIHHKEFAKEFILLFKQEWLNQLSMESQLEATLSGQLTPTVYAMKHKLKIGSNSMNILVTMSVTLGEDNGVSIGPSTSAPPALIRTQHTRIFYRQQFIDDFLLLFNSENEIPSPANVSCLRQLSSNFSDWSTFAPWRAALDVVNNDCLLPTTIFTLCDMPHNEGYGTSNLSTEKIASRFMQALAISSINGSTANAFSTALRTFHAMDNSRKLTEAKVSKDWKTLASIIESPEKTLNDNTNLDALSLVMLEDFTIIGRITASWR